MQWLAIILTALFTAAKLVGVISWSWWLVFLPAIILAGISVLIFVVALVVVIMQNGDY